MSAKLLNFTGDGPGLKKCASLLKLYLDARGIKTDIGIVLAEVYQYCFPGSYVIAYNPHNLGKSINHQGVVMHNDNGKDGFIGKPKPSAKPFLLNIGIFCLRSLIGEIRPQFTQSYGTVTTDRENCDSNLTKKRLQNLFQISNWAIAEGLIPHLSNPDDYIRMLMSSYEELSKTDMPLWYDKKLQNFFAAFFYNRGLPVNDSSGIIIRDISSYEYYANNIIPFYLDPEKDPFLSPYNYDGYLEPIPELLNHPKLDPFMKVRIQVFLNFCFLKQKKMITSFICNYAKSGEHEVLFDTVTVPGLVLQDDYTGFGFNIDENYPLEKLYRNKVCDNCLNFVKQSKNKIDNISLFLLSNNYLSFFWGDEFYRAITKENVWGITSTRDAVLDAVQYKIKPGGDIQGIIFGLWQAGLYNTLREVIKKEGSKISLPKAASVIVKPGVTLEDVILNSGL